MEYNTVYCVWKFEINKFLWYFELPSDDQVRITFRLGSPWYQGLNPGKAQPDVYKIRYIYIYYIYIYGLSRTFALKLKSSEPRLHHDLFERSG